MLRKQSVIRSLYALLVVVAIFGLLGAGDQDTRFQSLGHKVMCACGCNQILLDCNHVGCTYSTRMRSELASYIDRGDNDDLVIQAFVQNYGPTVLLAPGKTGFEGMAWIMPYLVLIAGLGSVIFVVRNWKKRPTPALADGIPHSPNHEDLQRFSEQIRKETEV